jgi:cytochrome c553
MSDDKIERATGMTCLTASDRAEAPPMRRALPPHGRRTANLVATLRSGVLGVGLLAAGVGCSWGSAAEATDFAGRVAPLLAAKCGACHGPTAAESGFRIDIREQALAGGDSGTAGIVPGQPAESELFVRVATTDKELRMPAEGEPLSADEQAVLKAWIEAGAPWPDDLASLPAELLPAAEAKPAKGAGHWSFQPVVRPPVPRPATGPFPNPIDAFVGERLAAEGLEMSPEAEPRSLIRRLSFDLVGLPPSPEEIAAFEQACRAAGGTDAPYLELVNRLLASPHHGERWARHWLDVVRFAESDGFETNTARANAWPYRDWVIESLNADKPYDLFVKEQLAGDAFDADAATGFLVGGPVDRVKSPDPVLTANQRADELHDIVSTTAGAFLGLTVGCARCHDHKFDPVPQADYYRLKAAFEGVQHGERPLERAAEAASRRRSLAELERERATALRRLAELRNASPTPALEPQVAAGENVEVFPAVTATFLRFTIHATSNAEPCLDELEVFTTDGVNVALGARPTASGVYAGGGNPIHQLAHVNDGKYGNSHSWISNEPGTGWVQLELAKPLEIERVAWSRDRSPTPRYSDRLAIRYEVAVSLDGREWKPVATDADRIPFGSDAPPAEQFAGLSPNERAEAESLLTGITALDRRLKGLKEPPTAYLGTFQQPGPTHRFFRGDPLAPREEIAPGSLTQIGSREDLPAESPEQERRRRLAEWTASPANPLTARVIVNRLWQHHFGAGIVDTPSDLGVNGGAPSHPALLDWLASELVEPANPAERWRLKHLHRLIVTSRTYRQATAARADALAVDAGSRLLWRYPPRRLEAEPLRDAILAVSGSLDRRMGGPGFDLFEPNANYVKVYVTRTAFTPAEFRRMVYQAKPRAELDTFFGAFDCPDAGQAQPARTVSTTPLQALNMLNGEFLLDQAERFAARVEQEAGTEPARQVARAVVLAFGREATADERAAGAALVTAHGLPILCRSLYNASEFITVY